MKVKLFLLLLCTTSCLFSDKLAVGSLKAKAAILINADSGKILYQKNANEPRYPASITKIATALYALEKKGDDLDIALTGSWEAIGSTTTKKKKDSNYTLPSHWLERGASHMGIKKGEKLKFGDLIKGMMIVSANDAANMIALHVSGDVPSFVEEMNGYLKSVGCQKTAFRNPHGHHDPRHKTCAYDMALIARRAMQIPYFRKTVAQSSFKRPTTNKQKSTHLAQTNQLLRKKSKYYYNKAIGIKTGSGSHAKYTLVAAAKDQGRELIAVIMGCPERGDTFHEAKKLFQAAFKQPLLHQVLVKKGKQSFKSPHHSISTYTERELEVAFYRGEKPIIRSYVMWEEGDLPVKKGDKVGFLEISIDGKIEDVPLYAAKDVTRDIPIWLYAGAGGAALIFILLFKRRK